ncbi:carboxylate-amine ligase [Thermoplasmatales archaeon SW_10_69_26]|nr:MAG: carboxylate-amine ligase [Thermoplasmatales archaeon SW_10_69_26]
MPTRGHARPSHGPHALEAPSRGAHGIRTPARRRTTAEPGTRTSAFDETHFAQTPDFTVGVEEELVLVDPDDGRLVDRPEPIEADVAAGGDRLQTEIFASTVETTTPVCGDAIELGRQMRRLRGRVAEAARDQGLAVAATGTHPFARWERETTTEADRYDELVEELQLPMRSDLVFGQHVHVSVGSPEAAIRVTNDLCTFLPLLAAVSTNAPFWRGMDTGLASARLNVSEGMPRSGLPPTFPDWDTFAAHIGHLEAVDALEDMTKVWWDVRPRPDLGTVEVRIADLPTRVETSIAVAALTQAIVVHLARTPDRDPILPEPPAIVTENRWRAVRHGVHARFVEPQADGQARLRTVPETLDRVLTGLADTIGRLGIETQARRLRSIVQEGRTGADRQRAVYAREGDLRAVVADLADRTVP